MIRRLAVILVALAVVVPLAVTDAGPAADQVALLENRIAALEARVTALEAPAPTTSASPTTSPTPSPTATAAPTPTATVTPNPTPSATPGPSSSPLPTPVPCGFSLQALLDQAPAGGSVDLGACVFTAGATITKPVSVSRGTIRQGGTALQVTANDVTIADTAFDGGNQTIRITGDRTRILGATFIGMRETSIRLDPGADDTVLDGITIRQTVNTGHGYSPISANDGGRGAGTFKNLTVRNSTIDQGPSGVAWFGIEVWGVSGLVIESNATKGAGPMASIPRSDGAIVRNNAIDLSLAFWGMELADIDNALVTGNVATGTSSSGPMWKALVQLHPGGGTVNGNRIVGNRLTNYPALVNAAGSGNTVTDNCLTSVGQLAWGSWTGPVTIARNGPC